MLKCVGCEKGFYEKEGYGEDARSLSITDCVCPDCGENLVIETKATVTEFIEGLLKQTKESDWDAVILPAAIQWNKGAYLLSDEKVRFVYETLKITRRSLNANPMSRYA